MSKRRGLSLDEKRTRMLQIFYEKREFFTLKELEKIAPKEKSIVVQSVKDLLQALVDDDLVRTDKIGTTIVYWAFPGKNIATMECIITDNTKKLIDVEFRLQTLKEEIAKEKELRSDTEERRKLLREVELLKAKEQQLKHQVAQFDGFNPEVIVEMQKKAKRYKDAINMWTDNIFALQSWCKKKFGISQADFNKQFNIPEDLDYKE